MPANPRKSFVARLRRLADTIEQGSKGAPNTPPARSRVSTPHWRRTHAIVHPEADMSEWVRPLLVPGSDWDSVVQGRNKN